MMEMPQRRPRRRPRRRRFGWWARLRQWWQSLLHQRGGGSEFLCDTCMFDHGSACTRPERPNARRCPDYRRR